MARFVLSDVEPTFTRRQRAAFVATIGTDVALVGLCSWASTVSGHPWWWVICGAVMGGFAGVRLASLWGRW